MTSSVLLCKSFWIRGSHIGYWRASRKPEGKRPLTILRCTWVDNFKMDLGETELSGMDCIGLPQDREGWRALVSAVMNL
jgi:hypothetical protein